MAHYKGRKIKRLKRFTRSLFEKFGVLIYIYILFIALWLLIINHEDFAIKCFQKFGYDKNFYLSWFSSFSEDLLFFGATGFVGLVITTKLLKNELFNIRIESLANADGISNTAMENLKRQVKELLSYTQAKKINIVLDNFSQDGKYIYMYVTFDDYVKNMCSDTEVLTEFNAFIFSDDVIDGIYGVVNKHFIKNVPADLKNEIPESVFNKGDEQILHSHKNFPLNTKTQDYYSYIAERDFHITENSIAHQRISASIWNKFNWDINNPENWFYVLTTDYTEGFEITITNNTNRNINLSIRYNSILNLNYAKRILKGIDFTKNKAKNIELKPMVTKKIAPTLRFNKGEKFEIFFS